MKIRITDADNNETLAEGSISVKDLYFMMGMIGNNVSPYKLLDATIEKVCSFFDVKKQVLEQNENSRKPVFVEMRAIIIYHLYTNSNGSTSLIGKYFNKDHATVLHSNKKFNPGSKEYDQELVVKYHQIFK